MTTARVLSFHPEPEPEPTAQHLQWQESQRMMIVADAVAVAAYQKATTGDLDPDRAALCRMVGTNALRSISDEWVRLADSHAVESCLKVLQKYLGPAFARADMARVLTAAVLSAHHGILDGTTVLPDVLYLQIAKGTK